MKNKITIYFQSIDTNTAKTFFNIIHEKSLEQIEGCLIKHLQTELNCNIL